MSAQGLDAPSGKKFKAWAIGGLGGQQKQPGEQITVTEETIIYAVWEDVPVVKYTVTFNANGGTGTMLDETDQLGGYVLPECGFTAPTGKQFKCWAEGSASGTQYAVGYEYDVTANVTFFAVWEDVPSSGPLGPGSNITPDKSNDGLSTGAIIGIVAGSVAVAGFGGFAIFWFVIKKKSFADLIAVFKKK
ncbi:MAG: InlB B-repeat-containing protein [Clostridia bacterium]|nr:InlB B-repeat-containing protein [Clostridia bacterium]